MEGSPIPNPQSPIPNHDRPEGIEFRFARSFLRVMLLLFLGTLGMGAVLAWHFEMAVTVKARGVIEPRRTVAVRPTVGGIIRRIYVRHGQRVNKGDTLFCLDDGKIRTDPEKIGKDIETAQAKLAMLRILAPISGTVLTPDPEAREGDRVSAEEIVLEIGTLGDWVARVLVREEDISKVRVGHPARLYVKAFPYMEYTAFEGKVEEISVAPVISPMSPTSVLYPVKVGVGHSGVSKVRGTYSLCTGMSAEVSIAVESGRIINLLWRRFLGSASKVVKADLYVSER